jgi:hypothetical protein
MDILEKLISENNLGEINNYLLHFENKEDALRAAITPLCDEYGLAIIFILTDMAYSRKNPFWFNQTGYFLAFNFSHIDGSQRMSLAMFKKSFEINPNDKSVLTAILDFNGPPEIVLTDNEFKYYSGILESKFT